MYAEHAQTCMETEPRVFVGCHSLLQGIFPTQGSNLGLLQYRQILYHLSYQGSPLCIITYYYCWAG